VFLFVEDLGAGNPERYPAVKLRNEFRIIASADENVMVS
jgi:hypothetical protein